MKASRYAKTIVQALGTIAAAIAAVFVGDGAVTSGEWINVAIIGVGAVHVWAAANYPTFPYAKLWASTATAVLTLAASLITDGLTTGEIAQLVIAALTALGVRQSANSGAPTAQPKPIL